MKKLFAVMFIFLLCGCVDLGRVGANPDLKVAYMKGNPHRVAECLYSGAFSQHLRMERDGHLSDGSGRYNLLDSRNEKIADIDISRSSHDETSVYFFQGRDADIRAAVTEMTERCKDVR